MRTKIVCTIGPASKSKTKLARMIEAGMAVARINFSHGTQESNGELIKNIRLAAKIAKQEVSIMTDLQGPRIRIINRLTALKVKEGETIILFEGEPSAHPRSDISTLGIDKKGIIKYLKKDDSIFIDNGMVELKLLARKKNQAFCRVKTGGVIGSRKGVNIPRVSSRIRAFTLKDKENLEFVLGKNVDFIAMSFVKTAKDILHLKKMIGQILPGIAVQEKPGVIAKIETQEAVDNFDEIIKVSDGIMVARGDLAIELPPEKIPALQKKMIEKCLHNACPVIVATQMLESMMENPRPTRAEITDVANAVIDHADALMLSGETALGKYPLKTVRMMAKIIRNTEAGPYDDLDFKKIKIKELIPFSLIAKAAVGLAREMRIKTIILKNAPSVMAYEVSRFRPELRIWYFSKEKYAKRKMSLLWGVKIKKEGDKTPERYVLIEGVSDGEGGIEYRIRNKN